MGIGLTASVAGDRHAHQARIVAVLQIAAEHSILDEHIALGGIALIVHMQRAAPVRQRAVVNHRHPRRGHSLPQTASEDGGALAIKVPLQAMSNRLMQQHPRPARTQDHRHHAGGRRSRLKVNQGLPNGLLGMPLDAIGSETQQAGASSTAARALLPASILLDNHGHREPDQRPHIRGQPAVGAKHEHHILLASERGHDLRDPGVLPAGNALDLHQQIDLLLGGENAQGIVSAIERGLGRGREDLTPPHEPLALLAHPGLGLAPSRSGNAARGVRGLHQGLRAERVAVGKGGLLPRDCAHANALVECIAARLHQALVQAPGL